MNRKLYSQIIFIKCLLVCLCPVNELVAQSGVSEFAGMDTVINQWHRAASKGDSTGFFGRMTSDAIYLGTDASERWTRTSMGKDLGKYFNGNRAWHFIPSSRNFIRGKNKSEILFDEILETWMGPCRGAGILVKKKNIWKIRYYQLSVAVPNDVINDYLKLLPEKSILVK